MRYKTPWKRLLNASLYSIRGLYSAVRQEQAFQYEAIVLLLICGVPFIAGLPVARSILLLGFWLIVMALELVNSAVERAFDLIDRNIRAEIREGKDMLSAAVFIMICFNILLWLLTAAQYYRIF